MNSYNYFKGGQSKSQTNMALTSELRSLCSDMTFYLERRALDESPDMFDPQVIRFTFRIARNGRKRFLAIVEELQANGISFGIAIREVGDDTLSTNWLAKLSTKSTLQPTAAFWRKEFYNHLRQATTNCTARLEFTLGNREDDAGQINLVAVLKPGLREKFEYAIEELAALGTTGFIKLAEQSI